VVKGEIIYYTSRRQRQREDTKTMEKGNCSLKQARDLIETLGALCGNYAHAFCLIKIVSVALQPALFDHSNEEISFKIPHLRFEPDEKTIYIV